MGQIQSGVISVDEFSERIMGASVVLLSGQLDKSLTFKPVDQIQPTDSHVLPILTNTPEPHPTMSLLTTLYANYYTDDKRPMINKYISEHILDTEEHLNAFITLLINSLTPGGRRTPSYYVKEGQSQTAGSHEGHHDQQSVARSVARSVTQQSVAKSVSRSVSQQSVSRSVAQQSVAQQSVSRSVAQQSVSRSVVPKSVPVEHQSIRESQEVVQAATAMVEAEATETPLSVLPKTSVHAAILSSLETPDTQNVVSRMDILRPVKGSNKLQKRMHAIDQAIDAERIAQQRLEEAKRNIEASYQEGDIRVDQTSTIAAADAIVDETDQGDNDDNENQDDNEDHEDNESHHEAEFEHL